MKKFFFSFFILLFVNCGCVNEYSNTQKPTHEGRFIVVYQQSSFSSSTEIILDTHTGQKFLFRKSGYGGGLTKL